MSLSESKAVVFLLLTNNRPKSPKSFSTGQAKFEVAVNYRLACRFGSVWFGFGRTIINLSRHNNVPP